MPKRSPRHAHQRHTVEERREILRVERHVAATLAALPEPLRSAADELIVVVEGRATAQRHGDLIAEDEALYGLFDGAPRGSRDGYGDTPPRITLFALSLVEDFPDDTILAAEIRKTVVHELGHYLGFDDEDLHRRGLE